MLKKSIALGFLVNNIISILLFSTLCFGIDFKFDSNPSINEDEPVVKTNTGLIVGKYITVLDTEIASFQGIPFAEPPLGDKRFEKPVAISKWKGALFAKEKQPSCMHYASRNFSWIPLSLDKSEDCLYLNIWVSKPYKCSNTSEKLPVMVWIHGGAYSSGSASMDLYDGSVIAALEEVIVVSMNYRVGLFGFLNGGISEAPGNVGLLDQLLALKWINANIQNFGGDSKKITLFGESAGSVSVALHVISPLSQGLFQKAIMESGTAYMTSITENISTSKQKTNTFAESVGCSDKHVNLTNNPSEVIRCLKNKTAMELAKAEDIYTAKFPVYFEPSFGANYDDIENFLPESPIKMVESGKFTHIPVLLGTNENEGAIFLNYRMPDIFRTDQKLNLNLNQAKNMVKNLFPILPETLTQAIYGFYFRNIKESNSSDIAQALSNAFGDFVFDCPTLYFAEKMKEAYMYLFTHRSIKDKNTDWVGVTHFYEVPYVFGKPVIDSHTYTPEDKIFSVDLIRKFADFAKSGHPLNKDNSQKWPRFSSTNNLAYELNLKSKGMLNFPRKEDCEFWRPYLV